MLSWHISLLLNARLFNKSDIFNALIITENQVCICENTGVDQLSSNCTADQRLCFCPIDNTMHQVSLTFSMLSNIVKSISQPTDVFSNFFPCFLNF